MSGGGAAVTLGPLSSERGAGRISARPLRAGEHHRRAMPRCELQGALARGNRIVVVESASIWSFREGALSGQRTKK